MKRWVIGLVSISILYPVPSTPRPRQHGPRNIILLIGDGMGVAQVTAARTVKGSLALDAFEHVGLVLTHAYGDDYITDSAASATEIATGVPTYNGAIAVGPDSSAVETVFEAAERDGRRTGLVVTCSITHATPACFVAHVPSRAMQLEIAGQIASGETDLYLGSGWGWFLPEEKGGRRSDGEDLIAAMQQRGYTYVSTDSAFDALDLKRTKKLIGLFAEDHCGPAQERNPTLRQMTAAAIESLSQSPRGFVLMVEGSQIDWAGHDNDAAQVPIETIDFDDAVAEAVRFAERRGDTLVIVTADHETGGYAIVGGSEREKRVEARFSTDDHTGTMIPLFAMGPGAERFGGIVTFAGVGRLLLDVVD